MKKGLANRLSAALRAAGYVTYTVDYGDGHAVMFHKAGCSPATIHEADTARQALSDLRRTTGKVN